MALRYVHGQKVSRRFARQRRAEQSTHDLHRMPIHDYKNSSKMQRLHTSYEQTDILTSGTGNMCTPMAERRPCLRYRKYRQQRFSNASSAPLSSGQIYVPTKTPKPSPHRQPCVDPLRKQVPKRKTAHHLMYGFLYVADSEEARRYRHPNLKAQNKRKLPRRTLDAIQQHFLKRALAFNPTPLTALAHHHRERSPTSSPIRSRRRRLDNLSHRITAHRAPDSKIRRHRVHSLRVHRRQLRPKNSRRHDLAHPTLPTVGRSTTLATFTSAHLCYAVEKCLAIFDVENPEARGSTKSSTRTTPCTK